MLFVKEILYFVGFYIAPGLFTSFVMELIMKRGNKLNATMKRFDWLWLVPFNVCGFYFASTAIKTITSNGFLTYSKTIENVNNSTYRHYALIDIGVLLILVVGMFTVLKDKAFAVVKRSLSVILAMLLILVIFHGRGPLNIEFTIIFIVGCFIGSIAEIGADIPSSKDFCSKLLSQYLRKESCKSRFKTWLPIALFAGTLHYFFVPMEIYLTNIEQFRIKQSQLMFIAIIAIMVFMLVSTALVVLMSETVFKMMGSIVFGVTLMKYVQEIVLNGKMQSMQGFSQMWDSKTETVNAVIWIVVVMVIAVLGVAREKGLNIYSIISSYIIAIFVVTIALLSFTTTKPVQIGLTNDGSLEVNPNKNTIVFVLDKFDSQYFERIVAEDPNFTKQLRDFTYYPDITCNYIYTNRTLQYLLSDVLGDVELSEMENAEYCYTNSTLLDDFIEEGYSIGIYTHPMFLTKGRAEVLENYDPSPKLKVRTKQSIDTMLRMSQYSCMPFMYKHRYSYSDVDCLIMADFVNNWTCDDDTIYYGMLKNEGLRVNEKGVKGAYKFIHLHGAHEVYTMNEQCERVEYEGTDGMTWEAAKSQAKGSLNVVYEYIRQLKELNLYDSSTILIIADHGQNYTSGMFGDYISSLGINETCRPLCLCKMAGDGASESDSEMKEIEMKVPFKVSDGTCTQAEIIETIRESITSKKLPKRKRLDEAVEGDYEKRKMVWAAEEGGVIAEYDITGDAANIENWEY